MSSTNSDFLKSINDGISGINSGLSSLKSDFESRYSVIDTRMSALENAFKLALGEKYGMNQNVPKKQWSWARYCYAVATKNWNIAPFEREEVDRWMDQCQKTMQASNFGGGGALIPPQYVNELIEFLRPQLITARLGVRLVTGITGSPLIYPKLTSGVTANWIAPEGTSITASDQVTGRLELTPHKVAALVKLSNDLIALSNPSVEAGVRSDIVVSLQEAIDTAAFQGTGAQGQPLGLSNWVPAISSTTFDNTNPATIAQTIADTLKNLENDSALTDNARWAMNPTSYWFLGRTVDQAGGANTGRPILQVSAQATIGAPPMVSLFGYPVLRSTLVSPTGTNDAWIGNWEDMIIAIWSTVDVAASNETSTAFQSDELWIRAIARVDIGLRRDKSFEKLASLD